MEDIDLLIEMENAILEQHGFVPSSRGIFLRWDPQKMEMLTQNDYFYRSDVYPRRWLSNITKGYITFEEILQYLKENDESIL